MASIDSIMPMERWERLVWEDELHVNAAFPYEALACPALNSFARLCEEDSMEDTCS